MLFLLSPVRVGAVRVYAFLLLSRARGGSAGLCFSSFVRVNGAIRGRADGGDAGYAFSSV